MILIIQVISAVKINTSFKDKFIQTHKNTQTRTDTHGRIHTFLYIYAMGYQQMCEREFIYIYIYAYRKGVAFTGASSETRVIDTAPHKTFIGAQMMIYLSKCIIEVQRTNVTDSQ